MESLKDIFSEIKSRLSSPLFGSFIIAWLVINWEIPIALIFYKQHELLAEGKPSFIQFIKYNYSFLNSILYPFLISCFYILAYPYIRNWVSNYIEKRKMIGEAELLKISNKDGYVSISKHQLLQSQLNDKLIQLTAFYNEQTEIENKFLKQEIANTELEKEKNELLEKVNLLVKNNDSLKNKPALTTQNMIDSFQLTGRFQLTSYFANNAVMSLSHWNFLSYEHIEISEEFKFDEYNRVLPISPGSYMFFDFAITIHGELIFNLMNRNNIGSIWTIKITKNGFMTYLGKVNREFSMSMIKLI